MKILNKFLDALYPSHYKCLVCSKEIVSDGVDICDECLESCEVVDSVHGCIKCGATLVANDVVCGACKDIVPVFDKNYSVFVFKDSIKLLLLSLKYNGKKYIASTFSEILYDKYLELNLNCDVVIPVPLHCNRLLERGYNQSELLCSSFISNGISVCTNVLERVKDTPHQTELSKSDRYSNILGAFKVTNKSVVKGKSVLLVDDVYTTGSTVNECSKVLLKAGARSVTVLTLCHSTM